jgi:hypothetical protein
VCCECVEGGGSLVGGGEFFGVVVVAVSGSAGNRSWGGIRGHEFSGRVVCAGRALDDGSVKLPLMLTAFGELELANALALRVFRKELPAAYIKGTCAFTASGWKVTFYPKRMKSTD